MADWVPGSVVFFNFPGGQGDLRVEDEHAYFSVTGSAGGRGYPIRKDDLCAALHAALDDAVASGWLFGLALCVAYAQWRSEPHDAVPIAQAAAAHCAQAALWDAECHQVFLASLAGGD